MPNRGQPDFKISIATTTGTTAVVNISQYITDFAGFSIEALTVQSDAFGDSWVENLYTGIKKGNPFTMSGFYEDTTGTGPHDILGQTAAIGTQRTMELDFGASDVATFQAVIQKYDRNPARGTLTRFTVSMLPTGAVTTTT